MKTVMLTGATGFMGSHLLEGLLASNYKVTAIKRSTSDISRIKHLMDSTRIHNIDRETLGDIFRDNKIDAVIHVACNYGRGKTGISEVVEDNLMFGLKILDACIEYGVPTFINTDTMLGKSVNGYALSKKHFVEWLQRYSHIVRVINVKIEHMYGTNDNDTKFISWVLNQFRAGVSQIDLTSGKQQRDFIYIDDVISAYLLLLGKRESFPRFIEVELGTGQLIAVRDFVEKLKLAYEKRFGPSGTQLNFGAIPYRPGEPMSIPVDNSALVEMGWSCGIDFESGIDKIIRELH